MILHNYLYRLKCIVRDRDMMFWSMVFPILLATLFNMAFSNISTAENFSKIKIGIVDNAEYRENTYFVDAVKSVSSADKGLRKSNLFDVKYISKEEGDRLLEDGKIEGYIYSDNGINLVVKKSGINQNVLKGFVDDYNQTSATIKTIYGKNPSIDNNVLMATISNRIDFLQEVPVSKSAPDNVVTYFYALIAMACFYGGFLGLKEVMAIQADMSSQGARANMAPVHKLKLFITSMFAATTVQLVTISVLICYLVLVLKINFGSQLGYILLTCLIGTITGVTFGTFIASVVKKGEGVKIGVLIGVTMLMTVLSGMMNDKIKYIISTNVPILGYLNPVALITDSFYSLYFYDTHKQFLIDIMLLCGYNIVFGLITYYVLRRQRYASL
ncbi:ABC transporter permease [Pseudobacteroides cellulosolvens]|uniref:ABC-2 type transporter transmembrane domain-containing protein n=1 Tax=Pseudobacteroides cellulosolvens ATCC 35603 = DSM 2933 TaxID=398512 RepID=A0A0L6JW59_9FIRM|nr:ABC transporter permease [Pseudobacteroides cellulosolvens]KNY30073.1 hypothetical protein Bccel_5350 [Pseudobacteroides cellulosolvens ATCC 35603 = DSM 2933]